MISRYRNQAIKRLGLSFLLLILGFTLIGLRSVGLPRVVGAVGAVIAITFAFVIYVQGNIALAKAKGYDGSVVAAVIIVACLCISGIFFAMPLILFFGLKDKTKPRRQSSAGASEITKRNPPAKLPPLR